MVESAEKNLRELTFRSIVLAIILTILLAISNCYLALKLGILTSASIPAAIISMGILRFFKNSTILENNAVQTAASAGQAIAGGIVYTIPALIIIQFWHGFDYLTNFFIAASGGILGVLFSVPLRRILVNEPILRFPEGRAIAEILKTSEQRLGIREIFLGGVIGGSIELLQTGFKVMASSWSFWVIIKRSIVGFGVGFSATMLGAGYLVGYEMALSIFFGAILVWLGVMPIISSYYPESQHYYPTYKAVTFLWDSELRYIGIGAMLFAGIWTFINLVKPLIKSVSVSLYSFKIPKKSVRHFPRTDKDMPMPFIIISIILMSGFLFLFFQYIFPLDAVGLNSNLTPSLVLGAVVYVLIMGFLFSVIMAYLSGMVGVSASPGSSVVIACMLFIAWILLSLLTHLLPLPLTQEQIRAAESISIIIGSVVTGIAAIANDNTQDLKVGQLVGATPWKQQVMLLLGVVVSAIVIPPVMQLLFDVYGIAGIMPREGMDVSQSLSAPTAALMAAITEAVFRNTLPWIMMSIGVGIIVIVMIINKVVKLERYFHVSILGVAIGMYLPLSSSFPLFLGGMIALIADHALTKRAFTRDETSIRKQKGVLIACGLVAGSSLMDVILAIPFSIFKSPDSLRLLSDNWHTTSVLLSVVTVFLLAWWIKKQVVGR